jgi:hypothetical protein
MSAAAPIPCDVASSLPGPPGRRSSRLRPARRRRRARSHPALPNLGGAGAFNNHPPAESSNRMSRDRLSLVVLLVGLPLAIAAELLVLVWLTMHLI